MAIIFLYLLLGFPVSLILVQTVLLLYKSKLPNPPGPRGLPIIGNLHQLDVARLPHQLQELSKDYGPIMYLKLGYLPALVISSPQTAQQVLKTNDLVFCSRPNFFGLKKASYNGMDVVLSPYNEYWREMKKIGTIHLFSSNKVHHFRPIREEEVFRMMKGISEQASSNEVINLSGLMMALTNTINCRLAFGKIFDAVKMKHYEGLLHNLHVLMATFYFSDHFPFIGGLDRLLGTSARLEKNFKDMDLFYQEIIDEHLNPGRPKSMEGDVIDILLRLRNDHSSSIPFDYDNIKAILMNFFFAGTDTIASTVIWIMTLLIKNPRVMNIVKEEVRKSMLGKERINEEDLQHKKLPYLEAVIKETMRLFPAIPLIPRESLKKCDINGYEIEPKTIIYVNVLAIGRDPQVWENPDEFLPERFIDSNILFKGQDFEYIPFGSGRRMCSGMYMAITSIELIVSNLLYSFDWELPPGINKEDVDIKVLHGVAMRKENALCLVAKNCI